MYRTWTRVLALLLVLTFQSTPSAQTNPGSSSGELREWAADSHRWLRQRVTPNPAVPNPDPERRGLVVSYDISPEAARWYHRSAVYDDALAALAFMVRGDRDAAAFVLHAVARVARPDGSFWFGYNTVDSWPSEADHDSALVRAGAIGWAGYAFAFYLKQYPTCAADDRGCVRERALFRDAAVRAADYLLTLQVRDARDRRDGLLRLGHGRISLSHSPSSQSIVEIYEDIPEQGISSENNISAWFFLREMASVTGDEKYTQAADRIEHGLLNGAWNDRLGQFNQGFGPDGVSDPQLALDCASWGALFLGSIGERDKAARALATAESLYVAKDAAHTGYRPYADARIYSPEEVARFYFPAEPGKRWKDLPLVWSEGTLGVALALLRGGERDAAGRVVNGLQSLRTPDGGLRYASRDVPFVMTDAPSVASVAWLVLVAESLAGNPVAQEFWR